MTERAGSSRRRQLFLAAATLALISAPLAAQETGEAASPEPAIFASARGVTVTAEDWGAALEASPRIAQARFASPEQAETFIQRVLFERLVWKINQRDAESSGALETDWGRVVMAAAQRETLAAHVRNVKLPEQIAVPEEEIENAYQERREEFQQPDRITFQHIFLDLSHLSSEEAQAKRNLANEIVAQLRENPDRFSELAQQYSDTAEPNPAATLGPIGPSDIIEQVSRPLWELAEGEVSEPIESPFGLHILRVVRRIPQAKSLDDVRDVIERDLRNKTVEERIQELKDNAEREFGLVLHPAPETLAEDTPIVSGAETLTGKDLMLASDFDAESAPKGNQLGNLIDQVQTNAVLAALAHREGWDAEPRAQQALDAARRDAVSRIEWHEREMAAGPITDADIRGAYEQASPEFTDPVHLLARVLELRPAQHAQPGQRFALRDVLDQALAIRQQAQSGTPFEQLIREHSTADDVSEEETPHWISPHGEEARWFSSVADLVTGEVSEPVRLSDGYLLVQVVGVRTDVVTPFEDVAPFIRQSLERRRLRQMQRDWVNTLRSEVVWSIPEDAIEGLLGPPPAAADAASPEQT